MGYIGKGVHLPATGSNQENNGILGASFGGFVVLCSLLLLFERLGVAAETLTWALIAAIIMIVLVFSISSATLTATRFLAADRAVKSGARAMAGSTSVLSGAVIVLMVAGGPFGGSIFLVLTFAIIAGISVSALLFACNLGNSEAISIPDYFAKTCSSNLLRLFSAVIVVIICLLLLLAELIISATFVAPKIGVSFAQTIALIVMVASFSGLVGGLWSVSKVQSALFPILAILVIVPAVWVAAKIIGLPFPQLLLDQPQEIALTDDIWSKTNIPGLFHGAAFYVLPAVMAMGFASLPHILGRIVLAKSGKEAKSSQIHLLVAVILLATTIPALYFALLRDGDATFDMPAILQLFVPVAVLVASFAATSVLLITMANTLAFELPGWFSGHKSPLGRRVFLARLLIILLGSGIWYGILQLQLNPLSMFIWALVFSAGCLFPSLVICINWKQAKGWSVLSGMISGLLITIAFFLIAETAVVRELVLQWIGVEFISAKPQFYPAALSAIFANFTVYFLLTVTSVASNGEEL